MADTMNLLNEELIFVDMEAVDEQDAIKELANFLYKQGFVKESYIQAILDREKVFPTGLPTEGVGVAIPHTDSIHVKKGAIALGVLKESVFFHTMGMPDETVKVDIIFMMAIEKPEAQLEILQKLMSIFQQKELLDKIKKSEKPSDIKEIFSKSL